MNTPWIVLLGTCLVACGGGHTPLKATDIDPTTTVYHQWSSTGDRPRSDRWWMDFQDPQLNALVTRLHTGNLSIQEAWTRRAQAKAIAQGAGSARWPQVDASLSSQRARSYDFLGNPQTGNVHGASLSLGYEVDLWNAVGNRVRAAELGVAAAELDVQAITISLTAQLVEVYYALRLQRATSALLQAQIKTNETLLELLRFRFGNGLAKSTDILQQEQNTRALASQLPAIEGQVKILGHQLAVLTGRGPQSAQELAETTTDLPRVTPLPALGLPADLVAARPDMKAAQLRMKATDAQLAAAVAARYPSFRIQASTGFGAQSFSDLLDRWVWSLAGSLVAPIFDGGRRQAEVDRIKAELDGKLIQFRQVYLTALGDVENALVGEAAQVERLKRIKAELAIAEKLLE